MSCPDCAQKDATIAELVRQLADARHESRSGSLRDRLGGKLTMPSSSGFDPAKCPCNPALGGSGICGCILSGPTVTCAVGA